MQDAVILEVADSETGASLPKCERGGRNYPTIAPESRTTVRHFSSISLRGGQLAHAHEWKVWSDRRVPSGKILLPSALDTSTNFVEHPELVADRLVQYARVVGPENVIGGVDCGFGTFAGRLQVDSKIVWMKLASLAEGAQLASRQLW